LFANKSGNVHYHTEVKRFLAAREMENQINKSSLRLEEFFILSCVHISMWHKVVQCLEQGERIRSNINVFYTYIYRRILLYWTKEFYTMVVMARGHNIYTIYVYIYCSLPTARFNTKSINSIVTDERGFWHGMLFIHCNQMALTTTSTAIHLSSKVNLRFDFKCAMYI